MKYTNNLGLPEAFVRAVGEPRPHRLDRVSVTQLLRPPLQTQVEYTYWDELEEDVSDLVYALLGTAVHYFLEQGSRNAFIEERLTASLGGWVITGQPDLLESMPVADDHLLTDWKVTTLWKAKPDADLSDWQDQVNAYAWLWGENGFVVSKAQVVAIFRDWSKRMAKQGREHYPTIPVARFPIAIRTLDTVESMIYEKLAEYEVALQGHARPCTPEERWQTATQWAHMRDGRKSAIKLYDQRLEAEIAAGLDNKGYVQERPGTCIRCEDFCRASKFCPLWQQIKKERGTEDAENNTSGD